MRRRDHRANILTHKIIVFGFEFADMDDHINFCRAVHERLFRLKHFGRGRVRAERKADDGCHLYAAAAQ